MAKNEDYVGKVMSHPQLGVVSVDGITENTRVYVEVTCLDRGKGWNEIKQAYTGVKNSVGWYRGENREFGTKHTVHINDLTKK